ESTDFMFSGEIASALAMTGTAVFRIVVSRDSMKKATATSQGSICFMASGDGFGDEAGKKASVAAARLCLAAYRDVCRQNVADDLVSGLLNQPAFPAHTAGPA